MVDEWGQENLITHEKPGVNDTIRVDKSIFSSQDYTTLYSWKGFEAVL